MDGIPEKLALALEVAGDVPTETVMEKGKEDMHGSGVYTKVVAAVLVKEFRAAALQQGFGNYRYREDGRRTLFHVCDHGFFQHHAAIVSAH